MKTKSNIDHQVAKVLELIKQADQELTGAIGKSRGDRRTLLQETRGDLQSAIRYLEWRPGH